MNKKEKCNHEIGRKSIGGFAGHENIHEICNRFCFNCNKDLNEIFQEIKKESAEQERERIIKLIKFVPVELHVDIIN